VTKTAAQIVELFRALPARDQSALIEELSETAASVSVCSRLWFAERAEIDEALGEAERGETVPANESFDDLAQLYGVSDA
jgi:hypothetical protein